MVEELRRNPACIASKWRLQVADAAGAHANLVQPCFVHVQYSGR